VISIGRGLSDWLIMLKKIQLIKKAYTKECNSTFLGFAFTGPNISDGKEAFSGSRNCRGLDPNRLNLVGVEQRMIESETRVGGRIKPKHVRPKLNAEIKFISTVIANMKSRQLISFNQSL
jgi:hypothetical protein